MTAKEFISKLEKLKSATDLKKYEKFFDVKKLKMIGVRMGSIFKLAKEYSAMDLKEVAELLKSDVHEVKVGAVSILDYKARDKKSSEEENKNVYDLYIKMHDRINTWDLVDRSAIYVVGGYLADKKRDVIYKLAKSKLMAERRTAIIATAYFMMKLNQTEDTFKLAEILLNDNEDLIHKAVGWMLRVAGGIDEKALLSFLDKNAVKMPRVMLRYAIEKFDKKKREYYMKL